MLPTVAMFRLLASVEGISAPLVLRSFHSGFYASITFFSFQSGTSKKWLKGTTVTMAVVPSGINPLKFMIRTMLSIDNDTDKTNIS